MKDTAGLLQQFGEVSGERSMSLLLVLPQSSTNPGSRIKLDVYTSLQLPLGSLKFFGKNGKSVSHSFHVNTREPEK